MANESIIEQVEHVLDRYKAALGKATDLIELKDKYIDILEEEIKMHKRNNLFISTMLVALAILLTIFLGLSCII